MLVRALTNYLRYSQYQAPKTLNFFLKTFEAVTDLICKPFQNIFYFSYDTSPLLAIIFIHYLGEPLTQIIFNLCMKLTFLIQ